MTYSYDMPTQFQDSGIHFGKYGEWPQQYSFKVTISLPDYKISEKFVTLGRERATQIKIECHMNKNINTLEFWSQTALQLKTTSGRWAQIRYNTYYDQYYCRDSEYASEYFPNPQLNKTVTLDFTIIAYFYFDIQNTFRIPKEMIRRSPFEIVQYMIEHCDWLLEDLHLENNVVKFKLIDRVYYIEFFGDLGQRLGFSKNNIHATPAEKKKLSREPYYKRIPTVYQGNSIPLLHHGHYNLHIYSNICKDMAFGNAKLPLLRSLSIDTSQISDLHGNIRNLIPAHPMYVDVRNKTISKIRIDIRDSNNQKILFQKGSDVVLTLHFKSF